MARNIFTKMKHKLTSKQLSNKLKLRAIKCYIHSTFLYGAVTWTLNNKAEKKIEDLEMWIYIRMGKLVWSEKNTKIEVLKQLKLKTELLNTVCKRQIRLLFFFRPHKKEQQNFKRYI
jgi:hypothetical protein